MRKGTTSIFAIINFPHLDSNIPIGPVYGVYTCISQIIVDTLALAVWKKICLPTSPFSE
jgi:hypothetical protein